MAAFDNTIQKMVTLAGVRMEIGNAVSITGASGQTFTIATKLKKVLGGSGVMLKDGINATATIGAPTNGQVTFTRRGPVSMASGTAVGDSPDTIDYKLFGY
jgi:hypothetical protein